MTRKISKLKETVKDSSFILGQFFFCFFCMDKYESFSCSLDLSLNSHQLGANSAKMCSSAYKLARWLQINCMSHRRPCSTKPSLQKIYLAICGQPFCTSALGVTGEGICGCCIMSAPPFCQPCAEATISNLPSCLAI